MPSSEVFSCHAQPHVQTLISGMLELERDPQDADQLDTCARAARSLALAARIAGNPETAGLAHAMENCFVTALQYDMALHPEQMALIYRSLDLLGEMARMPAAALSPEVSGLFSRERPPAYAAGEGVGARAGSDEESAAPRGYGDHRFHRKGKRVLVVDDSFEVREHGRKLLSTGGYDVEIAVDGVDAWNAVGTRHFDLVVTDISMPRLDGIELTKRIRADARFETLPVLIACDKNGDTDRWRAFDAGAAYYVNKNSFEKTLLSTVASLIGPARA